MDNQIWYTALETFDKDNTEEFGWQAYVNWSKLYHLKELISLDRDTVFEPNLELASTWDYVISDGQFLTWFYNSLDFVLKNTNDKNKFNLLALIKEPKERKCKSLIGDFEFVGYELLDKDYLVSAISNCGGFDETFSADEINCYGLLDDYHRAKIIQTDLVKNNPNEPHAYCNLFEVWRHKTIGRKPS